MNIYLQVPPGLESKDGRGSWNKGKIYISKTSPDCVLEAYSSQFQKDWSVFLKSRAEEIVGGGRMVLSFMGRRSTDPRSKESCYQWELLARALMSMVSEVYISIQSNFFLPPIFFFCLFSSFIVEKRMEALNQTESQHNLHLWSHCVLCSQSPRGLLRLVSWWHQLSLSLGTTRLP